MKKRLFAILLALTLALTLLPAMTLEAAADDGQSRETIGQRCPECKTWQDLEIIRRVWKRDGFQVNEQQHWLLVLCPSCHKEGYLLGEDHTGGTETPTCTTGKTCEKCGGEYGKLGHDWGEWTSNGDNKTHIRTCKRDGCTAVETENCGGDGNATCVTQGTCTVCGQQYYGGHNFANNWESDADTHWRPCLNENCAAKKDEAGHWFVPGNVHLKSEATCISPAVYYTNCASCRYKGTETYSDPSNWINKNNHDGGTEVKNAKAATCTEKGYTGDTHCKGCGVKLYDGTDIPATGHDWADATCTTPKTCKVCNATEGSALGHKLTHVAAKQPTTFVAGNIEYWYCADCGKYFRDAAATQEITKEATVTHKESAPIQDNKTVESSKTGDAGVMLYAGMAVLSLTGCAWLRRKEK